MAQKGQSNPVNVGNRYGRLVVTSRFKKEGNRRDYFALADCDCGTKDFEVNINNLRNGKTVSCGCLLRENSVKVGQANRTHGQSVATGESNRPSKEYRAWQSMKKVTDAPVDPIWLASFETFYIDLGPAPDRSRTARLTRIDKGEGFVRGNVEWVVNPPRVPYQAKNPRKPKTS